jgi:hypothetical protein
LIVAYRRPRNLCNMLAPRRFPSDGIRVSVFIAEDDEIVNATTIANGVALDPINDTQTLMEENNFGPTPVTYGPSGTNPNLTSSNVRHTATSEMDQRTYHMDQRTNHMDQRTNQIMDQRTNGPTDQRTNQMDQPYSRPTNHEPYSRPTNREPYPLHRTGTTYTGTTYTGTTYTRPRTTPPTVRPSARLLSIRTGTHAGADGSNTSDSSDERLLDSPYNSDSSDERMLSIP